MSLLLPWAITYIPSQKVAPIVHIIGVRRENPILLELVPTLVEIVTLDVIVAIVATLEVIGKIVIIHITIDLVEITPL